MVPNGTNQKKTKSFNILITWYSIWFTLEIDWNNKNFMFVVRLLWIAFLQKKECFVKEFEFRAASKTILYLQKMMTTAAGCSWLDYTKAIKKFMQNTYCLRWTSKTILIASSSDSLIGVAFNQISHRIFRAPTVHNLLCRIIRVGDVRPCYISKIFALFEGFHRFTDLK